ncbi:DtxR family transcriptional regulator [Pseudoclavibacter endophyticus]|uniref:Metal-dependent transcriptional regulator n=1 Tax=Pseudoclavibacter endophyticus TaxID=1778590 RepID=A0A6H9WT00_9MICO|nr:metal-dependent transcriptional regulator [Pseudoclavibacter endophyticus]KAB1649430.1 metal-dependent transcriptional regulator [Pseudoclavibacter endophyticus]GGA62715.1 DtxR family transcriptional regulator [Pseudoclavibacter endophyticus]
MTGLVNTTEMYLRTILDLEEEGIVPLRARISERLGHSGPTVSQTISRMERDGLVEVATDRRLMLTDNGREMAVRVLRKHRLAEGLLANVIGLDLAQVHEEACRWEHVMSEEAERRIFELLGRPVESPYGTPIPGLEEFGVPAASPFLAGVDSLDSLVPVGGAGEVAGRIRRFGEPVQADLESLRVLREAGILPGVEVTAHGEGDRIVLRTADGGDAALEVSLGRPIAAHIYISRSSSSAA